MREYTDFILIVDNKEIEFRHSAQTTREFFQLADEIIYDYYESQVVRKCDISAVRLDPRPFLREYFEYRLSSNCPMQINGWIHTLSPGERERILNSYQQA